MPISHTGGEQEGGFHQNIEIAGHARNVIQIGKIIFQYLRWDTVKQVIREQRAGFVLISILIIGIAFLFYHKLFTKPHDRMAGDFRIAVASFEVPDSKDDEAGLELAQSVYLRLVQAFSENDMNIIVSVWGPDKVGAIRGPNEEARARAAAHLAQDIGADVVVYGVVEVNETTWRVTPEFFISTDNFYEAAEITGQHYIGHSLSVDKGLTGRIETSRTLNTRIIVLTKITIGLAYYSVGNFEKASQLFMDAEQIDDWNDSEGKQVLYLLLGNTFGKSGDLERAENYYHKALSIDHEYARAYIGMGSVYYMRALEPCKDTGDLSHADQSSLMLAMEMYKQAIQAQYHPPLSDVTTKAHFGLGQCYLVLAYLDANITFNEAIMQFQSVIDDYGNGNNPRIRRLAAESYARLALIYDLSGYPGLAAKNYSLAASLLSDDPARQAMYERRAHIIVNEGNSR